MLIENCMKTSKKAERSKLTEKASVEGARTQGIRVWNQQQTEHLQFNYTFLFTEL